MDQQNPQILVYLTNSKDRVLGGDPLTLLIADDTDINTSIFDLSRALKADVVQLRNGDYMIISHVE